MVAGIVTTILLHGCIVGLVIWGTMHSDAHIEKKTKEKMLEFEDVKLLALGEKKPPNELPRIANPPAPTPDQETVSLEEKKNQEKPEDKKKTQQETESPPDENADDEAKERNKKMAEAFKNLHNPNRPTNTDVPEGSKQGVAGGAVSDEALANLMGTFQAKLLEVLGRFWQVPSTIPEQKLKKLFGEVVVYVRLSKDGHVVTYRFKRRSSNPQFDNSIDRLMRRFTVSGGGRTLPLPQNPEVKRAVLKEGLNLKKWEFTQR